MTSLPPQRRIRLSKNRIPVAPLVAVTSLHNKLARALQRRDTSLTRVHVRGES